MLTPACLRRRSHEMGLPELQTVTVEDAPVSRLYLQSLADMGIKTEKMFRWSNAVSASLDAGQIALVRALPFVREVYPVGRAATLSTQPKDASAFTPVIRQNQDMPESNSTCGYDSVIFHYGYAQSQLDRINVPPLHAMGLDATGVRLGFLDTGFRWRETSSLQTRHVLSEYDYVFHDSVTANQTGDDLGQDNHGTSTFSTAMGYEPDSLIGPAYNASVYLAKTEYIPTEHHVEEDNYAAALQDMEAAGVDVTTCSLGYFTFDPPDSSYTYSDLNGHTSICARAAARAAKLGVLMVTAMGNSGRDTLSPHMLTPADADSVISVGALAPDNTIADFSSRGPASDGRMKPEICAPGMAVWVQSVAGVFEPANGTSFATPLVSGACCLIHEAHPEATVQQIRRAIMSTGDNAKHPDTALGWGRMNAYAAALRLGTIIHVKNVSLKGHTVRFCIALADSSGIKSAFIQYHTSKNFSTRLAPLALVADSLIYSCDLAIDPGDTVFYQVLAVSNVGVRTVRPSNVESIEAPSEQIVGAATEQPQLNVSIRYQSDDGILITSNEPMTWRVFDIAGRDVSPGRLQSDSFFSTISTEPLMSGVYYLHVTAQNGQEVLKPMVVIH
ncbi:MAG: S8 family peptidase [Bacteroidota bacterium]|nr:S8 family peptidase [Bacteroidota bacterium]